MSKIAYWKALMINRFHGLEESDRYDIHHFYLAMDSISRINNKDSRLFNYREELLQKPNL